MIPNPADGFCAERVSTGSARRRRERRLRSWLRHDEDTEGARPDRLAGVRAQERDQRHTVEQIVDTVLFVPSLDVPVPQMENQLVDVCRLFDVIIPEQVIEVPKISSTPRPPRRRRVRFAEQTTEQLVEVPTIISYSSLQRTVEQNVNIPVPSRGGQHVGLQGFLPRQRSTALHASQERSSERIVEQIVDSRVLGGGSSASSSSSCEHAGEGVFRTFPRVKKSPKLGSHSGSELLPESSPSTPAAHVDTWVDGDDVCIRIDSVHGPFWKKLLSDHVQWHPPWERH